MACDWSRTPHARSLCIIVKFRTIAWGTQILGIDSHVRSYDRRTVSVEWSLRRANCKRFTHKRPTDGSVSRTVGWSGALNGGACQMRTFNVRRFRSLFRKLRFFFVCGEAQNKTPSTQNTSTVNRFEASPSSRLRTDCIISKLTRMSNVRALFRIRPKNMRLTSHCRA